MTWLLPLIRTSIAKDVTILYILVVVLDYAESHGWRHALGDNEGDIEIAYDVIGTPKIFIIEKIVITHITICPKRICILMVSVLKYVQWKS